MRRATFCQVTAQYALTVAFLALAALAAIGDEIDVEAVEAR